MVVEEFDDTMFIFFFMSIIALLSIAFIEKPHEGEIRLKNEEIDENIIKEMIW